MERTVSAEGTPDDRTENRQPPSYQAPLKSPTLHRALLFVFAYVFLLTLIGIIYKNELSWTRRLAYLVVCALLCLPICVSYGILAAHLSRLRARIAGVLSFAGSALLSAGSATVLVYGVDRLFRTGFIPNKMRDPYVLGLAVLLVGVSVAQYAMTRRHNWQETAPRVEEPAEGAAAAGGPGAGTGLEGLVEEPGANFFRRLPAALGRDVLYLKMSDHYVEVFTTAGHAVILMRFGDAVAELGRSGIRVHRSYWVANGHLERLVRRGRRRFVRVTGGHDVPVSRTYLAAIEAVLADATNR